MGTAHGGVFPVVRCRRRRACLRLGRCGCLREEHCGVGLLRRQQKPRGAGPVPASNRKRKLKPPFWVFGIFEGTLSRHPSPPGLSSMGGGSEGPGEANSTAGPSRTFGPKRPIGGSQDGRQTYNLGEAVEHEAPQSSGQHTPGGRGSAARPHARLRLEQQTGQKRRGRF